MSSSSNNNDPATALKNAGIFIQEGVDAVIQFNGQPSANPALAAAMRRPGIPVVTYDIAQPGFYFVGIDNLAAGIAGGEGLGKIVKEKWNCEPDLVISAEGAGAGIVNEWRTGGMRDGPQEHLPGHPGGEVRLASKARASRGRRCPPPATCSPPIPTRRRWPSSASMTAACSASIQAAEQLGRADEIIGWGQDGAFITGDNVNPHLAGSVFYFLEGYAVYAIRDVIDADRRRQPAAGEGRCRRSRLAGPAVPGHGRGGARRFRTCRSGCKRCSRRRRARPSTSCSARPSRTTSDTRR